MSENLIDREVVHRFLNLYHARAQAALRGTDVPGVLQLVTMTPDGKPHTTSYRLGDVDHMMADALTDAEAGKNVYVEIRTTRATKFEHERGKEDATVGIFTVAVDYDNDRKGKGGTIVGEPSIVVETSPGNFQCWYFLLYAISVADLAKLRDCVKGAGGDSCTCVATQPFRVPGTCNYPTRRKVEELGRVPCATKIVSMSGKIFTPDDLKTLFAAAAPEKRPNRKATGSPKPAAPIKPSRRRQALARASIAEPVSGATDGSRKFQSDIGKSVRAGMTRDEIEAEMRANPDGAQQKYLDGHDRLREEIDRSAAKVEASVAEEQQADAEAKEQEQAERDQQHAERAEAGRGIDGAKLLNDVHAFLRRFVAYPSREAAVAHVLWVAHTHLMDAWDCTPRLTFLSPEPGSGKSRALELTETLVPTPLLVANITPAYLFRKAGEEQVTLLVDEADATFSVMSETSEKIRKFLNASHRRGFGSAVCVKVGSRIDFEDTPCFVPVALAALELRHMPETVMSRSIVIHMRRRAPDEHITSFRRRVHGPEGNALRDRLACWAAAVVDGIKHRLDTNDLVDVPATIADRDLDVWEPLFLIADAAGDHWPDTARCNAVTLATAIRETGGEASIGLLVLTNMRTVFGDSERKFTTAILDELHKIDESPWLDFKRGKPLNDRGLAQMLRPYGIRSKLIRRGEVVARGYERADFEDVWARYLPRLA